MSNKNLKILIGVPPAAHVSLAMDELNGLRAIGYECSQVSYGRNKQSGSVAGKFLSTVSKGWGVVRKLHGTKPHILYLNSRFERVGSIRDFITLMMIRFFYFRKLCIVIKSHGSEAHSLYRAGWVYKKIILAFLINRVNGWIFLSEEEKIVLTQHFSKMKGKIFVAPNIIDPSRCVPDKNFNKKYNFPADKLKVLFVGRLVKEKGIFDIADAIESVKQKTKLAFVFVGNGPDDERFRSHIELKGLKDYCYFMGYLPDAECDHFYANADMLLFPSYDSEGFAMALFKSVAAGMPVIATAIRAAKDYLHEPENVLWVPEQKPQAIAEAIDKLVGNAELADSMRRHNKILGMQFSGIEVAKKMDAIFKQASLNS